MVATQFMLAASSIFALSYGAPMPRSLAERATGATYKPYGGDGTVAKGWPSEKDWKSFDELWEANVPLMKTSCTQFNVPNNSDQEIKDIKAGLDAASKTSGVKKEFLLAIMMQESKGCVRAPTTNYGVRNPGLMQDHDGKATCNEGGVKNPCPANLITQMITEGATSEFGLKQTIELSKATDVSKYYKAARIYNSGSIASSGNLGDGIATHCYASDIANRLKGWVDGGSTCEEGTIGKNTGTAGGNDDNTPTTTPTGPPTTPKPSTTAQEGGDNNGDSNPSGTRAQGAVADCKKWYTIKAGDTCASVEKAAGAPAGTLQKLNTGLSANCNNLWKDYSYCVGQ